MTENGNFIIHAVINKYSTAENNFLTTKYCPDILEILNIFLEISCKFFQEENYLAVNNLLLKDNYDLCVT